MGKVEFASCTFCTTEAHSSLFYFYCLIDTQCATDAHTEHRSLCKLMCWLNACSFLYIDFSSFHLWNICNSKCACWNRVHVLMSEAVIFVFPRN